MSRRACPGLLAALLLEVNSDRAWYRPPFFRGTPSNVVQRVFPRRLPLSPCPQRDFCVRAPLRERPPMPRTRIAHAAAVRFQSSASGPWMPGCKEGLPRRRSAVASSDSAGEMRGRCCRSQLFHTRPFHSRPPNKRLSISPKPENSRETPQRSSRRWLLSFKPKPLERRKVQSDGRFHATAGAR